MHVSRRGRVIARPRARGGRREARARGTAQEQGLDWWIQLGANLLIILSRFGALGRWVVSIGRGARAPLRTDGLCCVPGELDVRDGNTELIEGDRATPIPVIPGKHVVLVVPERGPTIPT